MLTPQPSDYCRLPITDKPRLVVVIDTEEEFDWGGERARNHTSVKSLRAIGGIQKIFDEYGITPVYVVDYPVVSQADGYEMLRDIHAAGRCVIGTHLHPWVSPPFDEPLNVRNSFPGNLPEDLERRKMALLGALIEERFGASPVIYKAGRYGIGANTARILEELGYEVDMSVCPLMDYSAEGGPDFTQASAMPHWFGNRRRLLELPLTVGFSGVLRKWGRSLHAMALHPAAARLHAVGILSRMRLVDRIWLSPEGYRLTEHRRLLRDLLDDGLRIFSFAFHSPSIEPGHTPYVKSQSDLNQFFTRCRKFFDIFLGEFTGIATTPLKLKEQLERVTESKVHL
jgi:hypothetical protein